MAIINISQIDTTPGKDNSFSPPASWKGSIDDYQTFMRLRYKTNLLHQQRIIVTARFSVKNKIEVIGPFAEAALMIIKTVKKSFKPS